MASEPCQAALALGAVGLAPTSARTSGRGAGYGRVTRTAAHRVTPAGGFPALAKCDHGHLPL